MLKNNF